MARLLEAGGVTLVVLIACSIISFIIIVERAIYFNGRADDTTVLLPQLKEFLASGNLSGALAVLRQSKSLTAYVLHECLAEETLLEQPDLLFDEIKSRAIAEKIPELERYLNVEATLAAVSPFIGLFGTVLGIIRSFQSLGGDRLQTAAMSELNAGIAEALVATAAGLFVAIPATMAYNHYRKKVQSLALAAEVGSSRLKQILRSVTK